MAALAFRDHVACLLLSSMLLGSELLNIMLKDHCLRDSTQSNLLAGTYGTHKLTCPEGKHSLSAESMLPAVHRPSGQQW